MKSLLPVMGRAGTAVPESPARAFQLKSLRGDGEDRDSDAMAAELLHQLGEDFVVPCATEIVDSSPYGRQHAWVSEASDAAFFRRSPAT
jgi:hypothetical protein